MTTFFQKFGRDVLYLSIIGCLAGWIWLDGKRAEAWGELVVRDLGIFEEVTNRQNQAFKTQIEKTALDYSYPSNKKNWNRVDLANKAIKNFQKSTNELFFKSDSVNIQNGYNPFRAVTINELDSLFCSAKELYDSLVVFVENDPQTVIKLNHLLAQDSSDTFWQIVKNSKSYQSGVLYKSFRLRTESALFEILNYVGRKVYADCGFRNYWAPTVLSDKMAITAGETFDAEVCLAQYATNTSNMKIFVNGNLLLPVDGKVHFVQKFDTPGIKSFTVRIEVKNEYTGTIETISKKFSLMVLDNKE